MSDFKKIDDARFGGWVGEFSARRENSLAVLCDTLRRVLEHVRDDYAETAVVETRVKSVSGFAEKCLRKRYADPLRETTDQCGGRIVCPTLRDKRAVRDVLSELLAPVDEYENTTWRHNVDSFGYLGYHMVVHFTADAAGRLVERWPDLAPFPEEILGDRLKCEIQVRTFLEHAYADISHDRLYKSGFDISKNLMRKSAMVAAQLESADRQLQRLVDSVDEFSASAANNMKPQDLEVEMEFLAALLRQESALPDGDAIRLRLVRLHRVSSKWDAVIAALDRTGGADGGKLTPGLAGELGYAVFRRGLADGRLSEIERASDILRKSADRLERIFKMKGRRPDGLALGQILHWLGKTYSRRTGFRDEAVSCFREAHRLLPQDPFVLTSLVEEEWFASGRKPSDLEFSLLDDAVARCVGLANAGIDIVNAWLGLAKIRLLQGDASRAAAALALAAENGASSEAFVAVAEEFARCIDLPGSDKALAKNLVAIARCAGTAWSAAKASDAAKPRSASAAVVMFAGATDGAHEAWVAQKGKCLAEAFDDFPGVILSGGSPCGVCKVALSCAKSAARGGKIRFAGYLPKCAEAMSELDPSQIARTSGLDYSMLEPLAMWQDALDKGYAAQDVVLVCLGGGDVSFQETMLALAMGANVYFLGDARRDGATALLDETIGKIGESALPHLHILPDDEATLSMFRLWKPDAGEKIEDCEALARRIHENYVRECASPVSSSNLAPWENLMEDFKFSNRHQAQNAIRILSACGYGVRRLAGGEGRPELPDISADVEEMARMEHGRWNIERLVQGWRYGSVKDRENRVSPCIAPWEDLAEDVRDYDRRAVRNWPELLLSAGLAITRKRERGNGDA